MNYIKKVKLNSIRKLENINFLKPMNNIPKALIILKASSGANWPFIKKKLLQFLLTKKQIQDSNLSDQLKVNIQKWNFEHYNTKINNWLKGFKQCSLSNDKLVSYSKNVLKMLNSRNYNSTLVCYIGDSYNTARSGNKKYPNL